MHAEKIRRIMSHVKSFPGMPVTAVRLLPLLQDPDAQTSAIEDILKYDPGLTANILKLTNSAYFGFSMPVSSVRQANMLLGRKRLLQLVMTLCMSTLMNKPVPGYDLPQGEFWRHSVAVSVAADLLVRSLGVHDADEVFTAALLHDIGKLVLSEYVQEDLDKIKEMVEKGLTFEVAEYIVLGINHSDIGARILNNWSLPRKLANAVSWHHDPEKCAQDCILPDVVHVANIAALRSGYGKNPNGPCADPSFEVAARLGLSQNDMDQLVQQTRTEVEKLAEILN